MLAALIGGGAAVLAAAIAAVPMIITARRVGPSNGHGPVSTMVERVLAWTMHLDKRMDELEASHVRLEGKVDRYHSEEHSGI